MNFGGAVFARPLARIYFSWEIITLAVAVELRGLVFSMINHNINDRSITHFVHTTHSLMVVSPYYEENKVAKAPLFFFLFERSKNSWWVYELLSEIVQRWPCSILPGPGRADRIIIIRTAQRPIIGGGGPYGQGTYVERKMMFWKKGIS